MTDPTALPATTLDERITKALAIAAEGGLTDGALHKQWAIDQMVRALTGCPLLREPHVRQGESQAYKDFIARTTASPGEGYPSRDWDIGRPA